MKIYAHRGASKDFPEHTMAAYLAAVEQGADGFECDLRLTKDSQLICWHDRDTSRFAQVKKQIANTAYADLSFAKPLLFSDLLELAIRSNKGLALETKHPVPTGGKVERELFTILAQLKPEIPISIMSFSWLAVNRTLRKNYQATYLMQHRNQRLFNRAPIIGPGLHLIKANPEIVKHAHSQGKKVYVWTVNSDEDVQFCAGLGVDVIMSDNPAQARRALGYS
jgi:glycerophosphoryl diester phosphodiesterase